MEMSDGSQHHHHRDSGHIEDQPGSIITIGRYTLSHVDIPAADGEYESRPGIGGVSLGASDTDSDSDSLDSR